MADLLCYYKNALAEKTRKVEELRLENEILRNDACRRLNFSVMDALFREKTKLIRIFDQELKSTEEQWCQRIEYMNKKLSDQSIKMSIFVQKLAAVKNRGYKNGISEEKCDEVLPSKSEIMDLRELKSFNDVSDSKFNENHKESTSQLEVLISRKRRNEYLRRKMNSLSKVRQENLKSNFRRRIVRWKQEMNSVKNRQEIWILKRSLDEQKSQLGDAKFWEKEKSALRKNERILRLKLQESLEEISSLRNGEEISILQNGVEHLNDELAKRRTENLALKSEIENLTDEISSLRSGEEVSILQNGVEELNYLLAGCQNEQFNWGQEKFFLNKNADSCVQQIDFMRKLCMHWCRENSNLQKRIDCLKSRLEKIDKSSTVDEKSEISIDFAHLIENWNDEKCRLKSELLKITSIHERFRDEFLRVINSIKSQFDFLSTNKIDLEKTLAETSNLCKNFQTQNRTLAECQKRYRDDIFTLKSRFFHTKKRYIEILKSYTTLNKNFRQEKTTIRRKFEHLLPLICKLIKNRRVSGEKLKIGAQPTTNMTNLFSNLDRHWAISSSTTNDRNLSNEELTYHRRTTIEKQILAENLQSTIVELENDNILLKNELKIANDRCDIAEHRLTALRERVQKLINV